jgi:hypothetical protein
MSFFIACDCSSDNPEKKEIGPGCQFSVAITLFEATLFFIFLSFSPLEFKFHQINSIKHEYILINIPGNKNKRF